MFSPSRNRHGSPVVAEAFRLGRGEGIAPCEGEISPATNRSVIEDRAGEEGASGDRNRSPVLNKALGLRWDVA